MPVELEADSYIPTTIIYVLLYMCTHILGYDHTYTAALYFPQSNQLAHIPPHNMAITGWSFNRPAALNWHLHALPTDISKSGGK